jgi:NADPH2:quinone reductase
MRAVVMRRFGGPDVLQIEDVPTPEPGPGEVLVRVGAVSINRSFDLRVREDGDDRGVSLPLVLGADPSGEIVALGSEVENYEVGDRVAVVRGGPGGKLVGVHRWGGYAEYLAAPVSTLVKIPAQLPFAEASVIVRHFPTALALAFTRAALKAGESVLVMGAAGALGSAPCCRSSKPRTATSSSPAATSSAK